MKTSGAEFKKFYSDQSVWTPDAYHDEVILIVDGAELSNEANFEELDDAAKVQIEDGVIVYPNGGVAGFEAAFRKWRKQQLTATLVIEVAKDKVEELKAAIAQHGGKVVQP